MRDGKTALLLTIPALLATLGCSEEGEEEPAAAPVREGTTAPTPAVPDDRDPDGSVPPPATPPDGGALYARFCASCHGFDGRGEGPLVMELHLAPLASLAGKKGTEEKTARGVPPQDPKALFMPAYERTLASAEISALALFMEKGPWPEPRERQFSGSREEVCAPCHRSGGDDLIEEAGCAGCHEIEGHHRLAVGPDLSSAGVRMPKAWIQEFLARPYNPRRIGAFPFRSSRMPDFRLEEEELLALTEFLGSLANEPVPGVELAPADEPRARELFQRDHCLDCHKLERTGTRFGPEFTDIGRRLRPEFLVAWLLAPGGSMPDPRLSEEDAKVLAAFLSAQRAGDEMGEEHADALPGALPPSYREPADDAERQTRIASGRDLATRLGCWACHDGIVPDPEALEKPGPALDVITLRVKKDWFFDFVLRPSPVRPELPGRMPNLRLTELEVLSIYHRLAEVQLARRADLAGRIASFEAAWKEHGGDREAGRATFVENDCHSCHKVGNETFPPVASYYYKPEENDRRKRLAPDLGLAAGRLSPGFAGALLADPEGSMAWKVAVESPDAGAPKKESCMPRILKDEQAIRDVLAYLLARD
ncbi:MAG: c-type cytochrome [Planctomycetes bacterium]|nr:c-type cytochrome [Planctomycetota bacterium]